MTQIQHSNITIILKTGHIDTPRSYCCPICGEELSDFGTIYEDDKRGVLGCESCMEENGAEGGEECPICGKIHGEDDLIYLDVSGEQASCGRCTREKNISDWINEQEWGL